MHVLALFVATCLALSPAAPPSASPAEEDAPAAQPADDAQPPDDAQPADDAQPPDDAQPDDEAQPVDADPASDVPPADGAAPEDATAPSVDEAPAASPDEAVEPPTPAAPASETAASAGMAAPPPSDRLGCDGSRSCKRMTVAGIVLGSLGLIGVGTGAGLLARKDVVDESLPIYMTSTRPPGLVAVTISAGVTLTAVLMLVAAHRSYKHRDIAAVELIPGGIRF